MQEGGEVISKLANISQGEHLGQFFVDARPANDQLEAGLIAAIGAQQHFRQAVADREVGVSRTGLALPGGDGDGGQRFGHRLRSRGAGVGQHRVVGVVAEGFAVRVGGGVADELAIQVAGIIARLTIVADALAVGGDGGKIACSHCRSSLSVVVRASWVVRHRRGPFACLLYDVIIRLLTSFVKWYIMTSLDRQFTEVAMAQEQQEDVRLTLRITPDLYKRIQKLASGDGRRPAAKINPTIVWLIERGLEQAEKEPGQKIPALLAA